MIPCIKLVWVAGIWKDHYIILFTVKSSNWLYCLMRMAMCYEKCREAEIVGWTCPGSGPTTLQGHVFLIHHVNNQVSYVLSGFLSLCQNVCRMEQLFWKLTQGSIGRLDMWMECKSEHSWYLLYKLILQPILNVPYKWMCLGIISYLNAVLPVDSKVFITHYNDYLEC